MQQNAALRSRRRKEEARRATTPEYSSSQGRWSQEVLPRPGVAPVPQLTAQEVEVLLEFLYRQVIVQAIPEVQVVERPSRPQIAAPLVAVQRSIVLLHRWKTRKVQKFFSQQAMLGRFRDTGWEESGLGELKLLFHRNTGLVQGLLRQENFEHRRQFHRWFIVLRKEAEP